jgi:hypothetical protein
VPVSREARVSALKSFGRRPGKDDDGLSVFEIAPDPGKLDLRERVGTYQISSTENTMLRLLVAAVVCDAAEPNDDIPVDVDNVDVVVFTDAEAQDFGALPENGTSESVVLPTRDAHRALAWPQEQLDALAGRLLRLGRKARRFTKLDVQEALLRLGQAEVSSESAWKYLEQQRAVWSKRVRDERAKTDRDVAIVARRPPRDLDEVEELVLRVVHSVVPSMTDALMREELQRQLEGL